MAGIRVCGLWEKTAPNGEVYYEGSWGGAIVRVYSNKYKTQDKQPDCVVYLSEKRDDKRAPAPQAKAPFQKPRPAPEVKSQGYVPAPTTKYAGSVPPEENSPPWPEGDDISDIPF